MICAITPQHDYPKLVFRLMRTDVPPIRCDNENMGQSNTVSVMAWTLVRKLEIRAATMAFATVREYTGVIASKTRKTSRNRCTQ